MNTALSVMGRGGHWTKALRQLNMARRLALADEIAYNAAMSAGERGESMNDTYYDSNIMTIILVSIFFSLIYIYIIIYPRWFFVLYSLVVCLKRFR